MNYNLIIHYARSAGYLAARKEIERTIIELGDKKVVIDKLPNGSVIGVTTQLEPKEIIQELKEKVFKNPSEFSATTQWIPVETWCPADVKTIEKKICDIREQINTGERWSAQIELHQQKLSPDDIIFVLKSVIRERYVEERGSKIVFIEFQGTDAAISILRPDDIFVVVPV